MVMVKITSLVTSVKAQVAFEFMTIASVLILITVIFGVFAGDRLLELRSQHNNLQLQEIAATVKNEIDIAHGMELGYTRTFDLPYYISNANYSVTIVNDSVVISLKGQEFVLAVQPVNGTVQKGPNIIKKLESSVVLNG